MLIDEKAFEFAKTQWNPKSIREFIECYEAAKADLVSSPVSFKKCVQHLADYRQGLGSFPSQETTAYAQIVLEAAGVKYNVD